MAPRSASANNPPSSSSQGRGWRREGLADRRVRLAGGAYSIADVNASPTPSGASPGATVRRCGPTTTGSRRGPRSRGWSPRRSPSCSTSPAGRTT